MLEVEEVKIENMIYEVRGKQVMLDSDLARLYRVLTGNLNKAVKRNIERFPENFMFQLTYEEYKDLMFQNGISNTRGGVRKLPYAFTEEGVAMLAGILHSDIAVKTSISIINAFVSMRKYISSNLLEQKYINNLVLKHDERLNVLEKTFDKFETKSNEIYFYGQIYDAYSKIVDIFKEAKKELIIVDKYADKLVLDMIKNIKVKVILITKENNKLSKLDIEKYNKQYDNLTIIYNNTFHDRYFILDKEQFYHCGASINYAGSKTFSINKLEDEEVKKSLVNKIKGEKLC